MGKWGSGEVEKWISPQDEKVEKVEMWSIGDADKCGKWVSGEVENLRSGEQEKVEKWRR